MNLLLVTVSDQTRGWIKAGLASLEVTVELNISDSIEFALRVLQVHDEVHLILLDLDHAEGSADGIKRLWRRFRNVPVAVLTGNARETKMIACVTAGALGYFPKDLPEQVTGEALVHVAGGSHWLPDCQRGTYPGARR